jgi:hypothetical protein
VPPLQSYGAAAAQDSVSSVCASFRFFLYFVSRKFLFALYSAALHRTALHSAALHRTASHCIAIAVHCIHVLDFALQYIPLLCILRCVAFRFALHSALYSCCNSVLNKSIYTALHARQW